MKKTAIILLWAVLGTCGAAACTSAIVGARASATGRPLLWKHRDTGAPGNFIARVAESDSTIGYTALFNDGDSLLSEVWMGMNDAGLGIMNTASYNLMPDTAKLCDREGAVMSAALATCRTVDDFEALLGRLPKPLGVQANFGVIDASGGAAYFETHDHNWTRFDVGNAPEGYIVRTNFSVTGDGGKGYGYIRYNTVRHIIENDTVYGITPALFTEGMSRSFYHSLTGHDYLTEEAEHYVADADFIPRNISTASIVIEGVTAPDESADMKMWTVLGYPPCSPVRLVTLDMIPADLGPSLSGWRSPACENAMTLRRSLAPYKGGSGRAYINLDRLRPIVKRMHAASMAEYGKK